MSHQTIYCESHTFNLSQEFLGNMLKTCVLCENILGRLPIKTFEFLGTPLLELLTSLWPCWIFVSGRCPIVPSKRLHIRRRHIFPLIHFAVEVRAGRASSCTFFMQASENTHQVLRAGCFCTICARSVVLVFWPPCCMTDCVLEKNENRGSTHDKSAARVSLQSARSVSDFAKTLWMASSHVTVST